MSFPVGVRPGSFAAWRLAVRVPTLVAAVVPVLVGASCAAHAGSVRWDAAAAALLGALCIQIGTNLANDVSDFERGADDAQRIGPPRAAQAGLLTPRALGLGAAIAFALAALPGLFLVAIAGPWVVVIGLASIAAGVAYTAGPFPLAYHGLGEVFVLGFFGGVAVCGTTWVVAQRVPPLAWSAAILVGTSATMLLVVNNVRDVDTDGRAGKRTLVVRFGRRFGEVEYAVFALLLYLVPLLWVAGGALGWWGLVPLATSPLAFGAARALRRSRGRELNEVLRSTARLMLAHGTLVAAAIAWG